MKVLILGATGMVGQGVLRECLLDPTVERVVTLGRSGTGQTDKKLTELIHADLFDLSAIEAQLTGFDACFFCLGVTSAGMTERAYSRVTHDLTLSVARMLAPLNPKMTFIYVSGMGTDSTEHGQRMWARVKGKTENALFGLPFRATYMFRPAVIVPLHGVQSKTGWYRWLYVVLSPVLPLLKRALPRYVTTTEQMGRAMLRVARDGYPRPLLEGLDIEGL